MAPHELAVLTRLPAALPVVPSATLFAVPVLLAVHIRSMWTQTCSVVVVPVARYAHRKVPVQIVEEHETGFWIDLLRILEIKGPILGSLSTVDAWMVTSLTPVTAEPLVNLAILGNEKPLNWDVHIGSLASSFVVRVTKSKAPQFALAVRNRALAFGRYGGHRSNLSHRLGPGSGLFVAAPLPPTLWEKAA